MNEAGKPYRKAAPLVVSAIGSAVLFYSGIFAFLFAVPVQVAYTRRGPAYGVVSAAVTAAVIVTVHVVQVLRLESVGTEMVRVLFLDSLMPVGLLAGLSVFNIYRSRIFEAFSEVAAGTGFQPCFCNGFTVNGFFLAVIGIRRISRYSNSGQFKVFVQINL
ncbi:MAG: hypothetical protein MI724_15890 [Spirochaetales bacterium]|nr:hypothetical protein [Spirochaetales bacterium]